MTDIEQKALAQAVETAGRRMQDYNIMAEENVLRQSIEAHARAIEQHEAFRQEVSDALEQYFGGSKFVRSELLNRFIIAKPDPLVDAWKTQYPDDPLPVTSCDNLRAAIEKRGGKIVWGEW